MMLVIFLVIFLMTCLTIDGLLVYICVQVTLT